MYSTVQYSTVQYSTVHYSIVQYSTDGVQDGRPEQQAGKAAGHWGGQEGGGRQQGQVPGASKCSQHSGGILYSPSGTAVLI